MDELEIIRKLASRAGREPATVVDVAGAVLCEIHRRRQSAVERMFWAAAAVASAAAVVVAAVAAWQWVDWQDPLGELFGQVVTVMR
jgi:uncharacterized membrane protein